MNRPLIVSGLLGATAIGMGAFGAHYVEPILTWLGYEGDDLAHRIDIFMTASHYQLHAATALLALALANQFGSCFRIAPKVLTGGALVFCGFLYALVFVGPNLRWFGAIVPLGGIAMIGAWAGIAWVGFKYQSPKGIKDVNESIPAPANDTTAQNSAGLVRVEELLMHQQHTISELNEVITSVQNKLDNREERFDLIDKTVKRLVELQQAAEDRPDERPPHY